MDNKKGDEWKNQISGKYGDRIVRIFRDSKDHRKITSGKSETGDLINILEI